MNGTLTRRNFLENSVLLAAVAAARTGIGAEADEGEPDEMPTIRLGKLEVSRVFLGSNPFFGFTHGGGPALAKEMREWYTPQRIMAVLDEAAELGINAVWTPCYEERWIRVWNEYRDKGGKLKNWIGQPDKMPMEKAIGLAVKNGATAICIQGMRIDDQVRNGRWDVIRGWIELIKSHGLPAGMATHKATTHLEAEEQGMPTDFYHQCLYRPDHYVRPGLEESLATIEKIDKPVVGYKVLGSGRIKPADTLPYVFKRLKRKDGICVGVFPKHNRDEIEENVTLTQELTGTVG
jgi:hypothetical protein